VTQFDDVTKMTSYLILL